MAKVYSWQVSNSPITYAYIKDPNNNNAYVGPELSEDDAKTVAEWVSNCTEEEYRTQFEKMKALCASSNYGVVFEEVEAYMSVKSSCDNLRGPAGRGISFIKKIGTNSVEMYDTYAIVFDDDTQSEFRIYHGKNGTDGVDGTPGAKGDDPVSTCFKMIYASGSDGNGNFITHEDEDGNTINGPARPIGGSFNFITNKMEVPIGWSTNDSGLTPPIWMSSRTFTTSPSSSDNNWSDPVQITGDNGAPGEDGLYTEFIYQVNENQPATPLDSKNEAGYVPGSYVDENGEIVYDLWTPSPIGVDEDNPIEWSCIRRLTKVIDETTKKETKVWGAWETPSIWSKYGVNGQDGDGVQYIYIRNKGQFPGNPTPIDFSTNEEYQEKDNEWRPIPNYEYQNIKGDKVKYSPMNDISPDGETDENGNTIYPPGIWTDNPTDVNEEYQYQWVSVRKYKIHKEEVNGKTKSTKRWAEFSEPSLWAKFGEQGKSGTVIRKLYFLTQNTNQVPEVPAGSVITGAWSGGFPKDYVNGENVVWGTEAELWAHNNEFVSSYMLVSYTNPNGEVERPDGIITEDDKKNDSTITEDVNCKKLTYLPDEEYYDSKGVFYKYILFDNKYYEWRSGGWCDPYLVSGLKGDSAPYIDYTTTAFVYGYEDYTPVRPNFSDPKGLGTSSAGDPTNSLGLLQWEDFPNVTKPDANIDIEIRIDGATDKNGRKRRWYQCQGEVEGETNQIKFKDGRYSWGEVMPNGPKDGESIMGNYVEYRFAVTDNDNPPTVNQYDEQGRGNRNPYYESSQYQKYGWFRTDELIPSIPSGGAQWMISATIDGQNETVVSNGGNFWSKPVRVSGERGPQGIPGPAGLRGTTGIPGVSQNSLYCLGVDSKERDNYYFRGENKNSEYYNELTEFDVRLIQSGMSSGYFGNYISDEIKTKEINNWFEGKNMPFSVPTEVTVEIGTSAITYGLKEEYVKNASKESSEDIFLYRKINENKIYEDFIEPAIESHSAFNINDNHGGIIKAILITSESGTEGATYNNAYHQYFLVFYDTDNGWNFKRLTRILTTDESEKFDAIIWGIQGNDIIIQNGESGMYKKNTDVAFIGNTTVVSALPDPFVNERYKNSNKPSEYGGKRFVKLSTNGLYYTWGWDDENIYIIKKENGTEEQVKGCYVNIKVEPKVVDETNSILMSSLSAGTIDLVVNDGNDNNYLPLKRVVNNKTTYDYIVNDVDITKDNNDYTWEKDEVGPSDCFEWEQYDGDTVNFERKGVDWQEPFRLQGVNGLRGLQGTRGQVIYPMGTYSNEEVYICTAEKAPYVYDPDDSLFYVLNIVDAPWVGLLPTISGSTGTDLEYYKSKTVPPIDYVGNYITYTGYNPGIDNSGELTGLKNDPTNLKTWNGGVISIDREIPDSGGKLAKYVRIENYRDINNKTTNIVSDESNGISGKIIVSEVYEHYKHGRIVDAFFEYIGDETTQKYRRVDTYKYLFNNQWLTDQGGLTPSKHYANLTQDNRAPKWVRFETFQALFASVGIISNGLIGSAVFNNEFMFSQQGKDYRETESNYKNVSSSGYEYGFLSGYQYDEVGVNIGNKEYHWRYDGGPYYLSEKEVDPYQMVSVKDGITGTTVNQTDLTFMHVSGNEPIEGNIQKKNDSDNGKIPSGDTGVHKDGSICYINVHPIQIENAPKLYLHTFMPNVCTNFASGQMWLATGAITFGFNQKNVYTMTESDYESYRLSENLKDEISVAKSEMNQMTSLLNDWSTDGKISPEERKILLEELKNIKNEYTNYITQANELGISGTTESAYDTAYKNYVSAYENCVSAMTYHTTLGYSSVYGVDILVTGTTIESIKSYIKSENRNKLVYVSNDKSVYKINYHSENGDESDSNLILLYSDILNITPLNGKYTIQYIDTKKSIDIISGDTNEYKEYDYRYIALYYIQRQFLLNMLSNKMKLDIETEYTAGITNAVTEFNNNISSATTMLENVITDQVSEIQSQIDLKAEIYYQDEDPSSDWHLNPSGNIKTHAVNRVADMWYDTGDNKSYTFAKKVDKKIPDGSEGKDSVNEYLKDGFYWAESNVPQSVFNAINGRSKVFVSLPKEEYHIGDIWYIENNDYLNKNFAGGSGITSGTCVVCIAGSTNLNTTKENFEYVNWGRLDTFADESMVNASRKELEEMKVNLEDWSSDGKISPEERKILLEELKTIEAEKGLIIEQLNVLGEGTDEYQNAYDEYICAYENCVCAITYHTTLQYKEIEKLEIIAIRDTKELLKNFVNNSYVGKHVYSIDDSIIYRVVKNSSNNCELVRVYEHVNNVGSPVEGGNKYTFTYYNDTDTIDIVRDNDKRYDYDYISEYYKIRQKVVQTISDTLNTNIEQAKAATNLIKTQLTNWSSDNKISPEERKSLTIERNRVINEYDDVLLQAQNAPGVIPEDENTDYSPYYDYVNAYTAFTATTAYYTNANNCDYGTDVISIITGETGDSAYKNYENIDNYYNKKIKLLTLIDEKLKAHSDDAIANLRSDYEKSLIDIAEFKELKDRIKLDGQIKYDERLSLFNEFQEFRRDANTTLTNAKNYGITTTGFSNYKNDAGKSYLKLLLSEKDYNKVYNNWDNDTNEYVLEEPIDKDEKKNYYVVSKEPSDLPSSAFTKIEEYNLFRTNLLRSANEKIKDNIDSAKAAADKAVTDIGLIGNVFGVSSNTTGATLTEFLGVKHSGTNNLSSIINGNSNYPNTDTKSTVVFASGIDDIDNSDIYHYRISFVISSENKPVFYMSTDLTFNENGISNMLIAFEEKSLTAFYLTGGKLYDVIIHNVYMMSETDVYAVVSCEKLGLYFISGKLEKLEQSGRYINKIYCAKTKILDDGELITRDIKLNIGEFVGKITATGTFNGNGTFNGTIEGESLTTHKGAIYSTGETKVANLEFIAESADSIPTGETGSVNFYGNGVTLTKKNSGNSNIEYSDEFIVYDCKFSTLDENGEIKIPIIKCYFEHYTSRTGNFTAETIYYYSLDNGASYTEYCKANHVYTLTFDNRASSYLDSEEHTLTGSTITEKETIKIKIKVRLSNLKDVQYTRKSEVIFIVNPNAAVKITYGSAPNNFYISKKGLYFKQGDTQFLFTEGIIKLRVGSKGITITKDKIIET